jgi:hypothetical protein
MKARLYTTQSKVTLHRVLTCKASITRLGDKFGGDAEIPLSTTGPRLSTDVSLGDIGLQIDRKPPVEMDG